jgi:hypothetical protein
MRCMLQVELPIEAGNAGIMSGKLPEVVAATMEKWKPETAYFFAINGKRAMQFVVNLDDPSQVPQICEPLFLALHAQVYVTPCMTVDDLKKGLGSIEGERKRWA